MFLNFYQFLGNVIAFILNYEFFQYSHIFHSFVKERSKGWGKFKKLLYTLYDMSGLLVKLGKILVLSLFQMNHDSTINGTHYFSRVLLEKFCVCVCVFTFYDLLQVPLVFDLGLSKVYYIQFVKN